MSTRAARNPVIRSALAAAVATLLVASAVLGYEGEVPATVTVSVVSDDIVAGEPIEISATVLGPSGTGVPDVLVTFEITVAPPGAHDVLTTTPTALDQPAPNAVYAVYRPSAPEPSDDPYATHASVVTATTNQDGVATAYIVLDAVVGSRTIEADAEGEALGAITITLQAAGLPNTATSSAPSDLGPERTAMLLIFATAGLGLLGGSIGILSQRGRRL